MNTIKPKETETKLFYKVIYKEIDNTNLNTTSTILYYTTSYNQYRRQGNQHRTRKLERLITSIWIGQKIFRRDKFPNVVRKWTQNRP